VCENKSEGGWRRELKMLLNECLIQRALCIFYLFIPLHPKYAFFHHHPYACFEKIKLFESLVLLGEKKKLGELVHENFICVYVKKSSSKIQVMKIVYTSIERVSERGEEKLLFSPPRRTTISSIAGCNREKLSFLEST
jgi:hypothetical protein